jgi:SAM-dependent methyltransferase
MMVAGAGAPPKDKSRLSHGWIYHRLFDPPLAETRRAVLDLITPGSSVLDIACGTGQMCFLLHEERGCRAVGIDLSKRQIEFARRRNPYPDVTFVHQDATDLSPFVGGSFEYATVLFWMHEIPRDVQVGVLREALRVARQVVIADSTVPLPRNAYGLGIRVVEASFGLEHYNSLRRFLAGGGLMGIVGVLNPAPLVKHRGECWHGCREVVMISRPG